MVKTDCPGKDGSLYDELSQLSLVDPWTLPFTTLLTSKLLES